MDIFSWIVFGLCSPAFGGEVDLGWAMIAGRPLPPPDHRPEFVLGHSLGAMLGGWLGRVLGLYTRGAGRPFHSGGDWSDRRASACTGS
jgi:hypothetical protein